MFKVNIKWVCCLRNFYNFMHILLKLYRGLGFGCLVCGFVPQSTHETMSIWSVNLTFLYSASLTKLFLDL